MDSTSPQRIKEKTEDPGNRIDEYKKRRKFRQIEEAKARSSEVGKQCYSGHAACIRRRDSTHRIARRAGIIRRRKQGTLGRCDVAIKRRFSLDPLDAFAGFLCESYWRQRRDNRQMHDAEWIHNHMLS
ncbi:hypothetical protein N7474_004931 [Penicillium riverlandense]|uniref:uncharacterized protein n=1 Tax=Penicillium riverlandense TaxID=1903569 RepID=UPI0025487EBC|nr:uncharacterized protein N7474_004931 [Penicillium riverlandense]KAJ5819340.1 hypothetical protein N7474_004931 [Penicillium riverlandense]